MPTALVLANLIDDSASLQDLEDVQAQLYSIMVQRFGASAAAGVLGKALAGLLQPAAAAAAGDTDVAQPANNASSTPAAVASAAAVVAAAAAAVKPVPILKSAQLPPRPPATRDTAADSASEADSTAAAAAGDADASLPRSKSDRESLYRSVSFRSDVSDVDSAASDTASDTSSVSRHRWHRAVARVLAGTRPDPWASRGLHNLPMEVVTRLRYTAATRQWVKDSVLVKIELKPFAAGAMRECYAMKKLSTFSSAVYRDWKRAPNFVAKRYKKPVDRDVYFSDVVLQMDAKWLGDEYSKIPGVPKKVDFMQAAVIEFKDRPGKPVLAVEHLIEGDYVKYNSNSGYVATSPLPPLAAAAAASNGLSSSDSQQQQQQQQPQPPLVSSPSNVAQEQALRNTPQAFSHFTFEFTKGSALCVDIQGVGDLYTDPQIHTLDGQGYGDGNLALRGMALFFRTHECNMLCKTLCLRPFDRCATDVAAQGYTSSSSTTHSQGTVFRSFARGQSIASRLMAQRRKEQQLQLHKSLEQLTAQLQSVPLKPAAEGLVHWEVARLYAETVTLPELRPNEDPEDAQTGGLFHLTTAAAKGMALAQLVLACGHMGLQPTSTQLSHLLSAGRASGELKQHPQLALLYTKLAAERGILSAAAALAYAYATGEGVGHGVLSKPQPAQAVKWLRIVLDASADAVQEGNDTFADAPDALNLRGSGSKKPPMLKPSPSKRVNATGVPAGAVSFVGPCIGEDGVTVGSMFTLADQLSTAADAALEAARSAFDQAAEEEGKLLPGGDRARWDLLAELGELLLAGDSGAGNSVDAAAAPDADTDQEPLLMLARDPTAAAEAFMQAAEEAAAAFKGKLSQRYFDRAAAAEAAAEEQAEAEC